MNEQEKKEQEPLRGFPITFNVYARNEQEVEDLRMAVVGFISAHAHEGRAVDAARLAQAIKDWDKNLFVKSRICEYFK